MDKYEKGTTETNSASDKQQNQKDNSEKGAN